MPTLTTRDGTELYFKDWGKGRPVVLMHGWPLSADTWDYQAMELAEAGYRVIAYDRRGFGRSGQPWSGYEYDTLSDDLAEVMNATGARDATIVGFSMGGGEVARYMSRHGGKGVKQAVLIGSVVPGLPKSADNPQGVEAEFLDDLISQIETDRAAFFAGFFKDFYGVGLMAHPVSDAVLDWSWNLAMQASLKATIECVNAFGRTNFHADLPHFKVPTLIIHGTGDATVPVEMTARAAAKKIPGAKLVEYDGGPHGLLASHQAEVTRDLLAFLKS
jgi:non-heme chloroperoxidase